VKRLNCNVSFDGSKEISIEGPVQAALLDLSEFKHEDDGGYYRHSTELIHLECIASEFGMAENQSNAEEVDQHSSQAESFSSDKVEPNAFLKLQELSCEIEELDFLSPPPRPRARSRPG